MSKKILIILLLFLLLFLVSRVKGLKEGLAGPSMAYTYADVDSIEKQDFTKDNNSESNSPPPPESTLPPLVAAPDEPNVADLNQSITPSNTTNQSNTTNPRGTEILEKEASRSYILSSGGKYCYINDDGNMNCNESNKDNASEFKISTRGLRPFQFSLLDDGGDDDNDDEQDEMNGSSEYVSDSKDIDIGKPNIKVNIISDNGTQTLSDSDISQMGAPVNG